MSAPVPSLREVLGKIKCSCCGQNACIMPPINKIRFIYVGQLCSCMSSGGSPICCACFQRQKQIQKSQWGKQTWIGCTVCHCYIQWSSKDFFFKGESVELTNALLAQARFRFAFPHGFGSIKANGPLNDFFETFKSLGGDQYVYERFAIVLSAYFAQSSRPRVFPMPQEGFFSKKIHRRMRCLSMTRKLFFKLLGISCHSIMFKLGYSEPNFRNINDYCGNFLILILKRILASFYLLQ